MTPLTPAGQALDAWATLELDLEVEVSEADRNQYLPHFAPVLGRHRSAIERQAADRALAELRREVEAEQLSFTPTDGYPKGLYDGLDIVLAIIDKASKPEETP